MGRPHFKRSCLSRYLTKQGLSSKYILQKSIVGRENSNAKVLCPVVEMHRRNDSSVHQKVQRGATSGRGLFLAGQICLCGLRWTVELTGQQCQQSSRPGTYAEGGAHSICNRLSVKHQNKRGASEDSTALGLTWKPTQGDRAKNQAGRPQVF